MYVPQYNFNLGYDPLLAKDTLPNDYMSQIDSQIQQLNDYKAKLQNQINNPNYNTNNQTHIQEHNLWDEIDKEVNSLNADQKAMLAEDIETFKQSLVK